MNKIKLLIGVLWYSISVTAQLTLTYSGFSPVAGDVSTIKGYDTTLSLSRQTGLNKVWDYSSIIPSSMSQLFENKYISISAVPGGSVVFPSANYAYYDGVVNQNTFYYIIRTTANGVEHLGRMVNGIAIMNYSNPQIPQTYPFGYGDTFSDTYVATAGSAAPLTNITGSLIVKGTGTGTVILPGNLVLTNCLQTCFTQTIVQINSTSTMTTMDTLYNYYHSSSKFRVVSLKNGTTKNGTIINRSVTVSLNPTLVNSIVHHQALANSIFVFCDPNMEVLRFRITSAVNGDLQYRISDLNGTEVLRGSGNFGTDTEISISSLSAGVYVIEMQNEIGVFLKKKFVKL